MVYTLGSGSVDQNISLMDNTECGYGVEIYYDAALTTPVD